MVTPTKETNKTPKSGNIFSQPLTIFDVPVDRETIFKSHKGVYKKQVEKRQRKLIVKSTAIKFFLQDDETIRCLTTGYSPVSILEQVLTGPAFIFFKRALLIFTNKRILHMPTHFDRSPRSTLSQILYEDCAWLEIKGRALHVQYKNGRNEIFPYVGRKEKKKLRILISELTLSPKDAGRLQERVYLCPSCTSILPKTANKCEGCSLGFKTALQGKLFASLIPGGGYFYARYQVMGALAALTELFLIGYIIVQWFAYQKQVPINYWLALAAIAGLIAAKAVGAYHTSTLLKDFVPLKEDFPREKK